MEAPLTPNKELELKARMYRLAPAIAVIAVVVEGLGAGFKWG